MKNKHLSVLFSLLLSALGSRSVSAQVMFSSLDTIVKTTVLVLNQQSYVEYHKHVSIDALLKFADYKFHSPPPPRPAVDDIKIDMSYEQKFWNPFDVAFLGMKDSLQTYIGKPSYELAVDTFKIVKHVVLAPDYNDYYSAEIFYVEITMMVNHRYRIAIVAPFYYLNESYYLIEPLYPGIIRKD